MDDTTEVRQEGERWVIRSTRWGLLTACPCCNKPIASREKAQLLADNLALIDAEVAKKLAADG